MRTSEGWFSDDEFWEVSFPFMFPADGFSKGKEQAQQILALTGMERGRVLDLGCGPGRHAVPLARLGFDVTGVDRTPFLLSHARRYAGAEGVDVEWVQADMREFRRAEAFDLAISIFTSFGFFESAEENQRVLTNLAESLMPGGKLVMDLLGKEPLARKFVETEAREVEGLGVVFQRRRIVDDWTLIESDWTLVRGATARRFQLRVRIYSAGELRQMLRAAGFDAVRFYGDLSGNPYDVNAKRLVAVASRV